MQRCLTLFYASVVVVGFAAPALAQPTIATLTTGGVAAYGGGGPNSPGSFDITGTNFSTVAKAVRFVDAGNADVLTGVSCSNTTTCTASGVRPYRVAKGTVATIQVFAMVNGVKSASSASLIYYGEPVVSSVVPNTGAYNVTTPYALNGGPWTSGGSFPGTTSVYLFSSIFDGQCTSTSVCNRSATAVSTDCCVNQGAYNIDIRTVGGTTNSYFLYGATPATPSISSVKPASGNAAGGDVVTITGTNFIPGANRTTFTFITHGSFGTSNQATGVSCTATSCTMVAPNGGSGGPADIMVATSCAPSAPQCGSANPRTSGSVPFTKVNAFAYAGIKVTTDNNTYNLNTSENGGTALYRVSLTSQPTANVTIAVSLSGGGSGVLLSTSTLLFTPQNWAEWQPVTITGGNNGGASDTGYTIRNVATSTDLNYNNLERDTAVTNRDNQAKAYVVTPTSGLVTTRIGGTATFTVALSHAPDNIITMNFASSDPTAGTVSPASVTFTTTPNGATGYATARTITVTGASDASWAGRNRDYSILITTSGSDPIYGNNSTLFPPDVQVTNIDAAIVPTGLSLVRTGPGVATATWNTNSNADYYQIRYSLTPGGAKTLAASGMPGQTIGGLTLGQQYYFNVSSVNAAGSSSSLSAEVPFIMYPPAPFGAFDGDSRAEMTYYTSGGAWHILNSTTGYASGTTASLGGVGYTPVMGDYDGDQREDVAVYNTATGAWNILLSSTNFTTSLNINWGGAGFLPEPGDYDGDGRTDPTVYQPSTGKWSVLTSSSNYTATILVSWGGPGYVPIPGQDFDGDFQSDIAIYQPSTGSWMILKSSTNYTATINKSWGGAGYTLVPGDYDGDGKADLGLYQRSTGAWAILLSNANFTTALNQNWGGAGYLPVPGDYDADGKIDLGIFEQATGNWYVLLSTTSYTTTVSATAWGTSADRPISSAIFVGGDDASRAADFDADGRAEMTIYNTTSGSWSSLTSTSAYLAATNRNWGGTGYTAAPGDYDGDGKADLGIYQGSTGNWSILLSGSNFTTSLTKSAGGAGWIPVPGDYDGDGKTDFVAYNTTTGQWFGLKSSTNYTTTVNISYGGSGYTAVPGDFDGDGKTDIGVYQASTGNWSVLLAASNYTTSLSKNVGGAGYIPVQGDYDGDGKTDFVVYNTTTGLWYGLKSSTNYTTTVNVGWGGTGYAPVKGDYDGDGKTDLAIYQVSSGNWSILLSSANYTTSLSKNWGGAGYIAVPVYP